MSTRSGWFAITWSMSLYAPGIRDLVEHARYLATPPCVEHGRRGAVVDRGFVARFNWAKRDLAGAPADLIRQSISPGWTRTVETVEILYRSDQPDVVRGA
jgi:hypothetical protein